MTTVVIGTSEDLSQTISVILKVRWPKLILTHVNEPKAGLALIHSTKPDLVILQPGENPQSYFDLIGQIRICSDVPIIVLSSDNNVTDKVRALEMGADDWIAPSSVPMEFIAKVNALLRRCSPHSKDHHISSFLNGNLRINYDSHEVSMRGKSVKLTPIEYKILSQLSSNEGSIVSYSDLLLCAWGPTYEADHEFVKKYIHRLRYKIESNPTHPEIILTSRGEGYLLAESPHSTN